MHIELRKPNIAVGSVIGNTDLELATFAQPAGNIRHADGGFAPKPAGQHIGIGVRVSATKNGAPDIGRESSRSSISLAGNASTAAMMTCGYSTSIISTQSRRISQRIENTQWASGWCFGKKKWEIYNCFAPTAIASKPIRRTGGQATFSTDIACRRIEQAYAQPDMFIEAEKPTLPKQLDLMEPAE